MSLPLVCCSGESMHRRQGHRCLSLLVTIMCSSCEDLLPLCLGRYREMYTGQQPWDEYRQAEMTFRVSRPAQKPCTCASVKTLIHKS